MDLLLLLLVFLPIFLPAILISFAQGRSWRPIAGWFALAIGLLWLDDRNVPFTDGGMFSGIGSGILSISAILGGIALVARLFRSVDGEQRPPMVWAADWVLPVAVLSAVFFFHWLANRLAGYEPAADAHFAVVAVCLVAVGLLSLKLPRTQAGLDPRPLLFAFFATLMGLTLNAAATGFDRASTAKTAAGGRKFCLITHAGRNRARQATSRWQLSPLVSRRNGRSYLDDHAAWAMIQHDPVPLGKTSGHYRQAPYLGGDGPASCLPDTNGGLAD